MLIYQSDYGNRRQDAYETGDVYYGPNLNKFTIRCFRQRLNRPRRNRRPRCVCYKLVNYRNDQTNTTLSYVVELLLPPCGGERYQ